MTCSTVGKCGCPGPFDRGGQAQKGFSLEIVLPSQGGGPPAEPPTGHGKPSLSPWLSHRPRTRGTRLGVAPSIREQLSRARQNAHQLHLPPGCRDPSHSQLCRQIQPDSACRLSRSSLSLLIWQMERGCSLHPSSRVGGKSCVRGAGPCAGESEGSPGCPLQSP